MQQAQAKPRMVFFQNRYDGKLPEFLLTHTREHVACLALHFDLVVIHDDCDYTQICDRYRPDLALFESGVNLFTCAKPRVRNVRQNNSIPKLALLNADAWCETRAGSLAEMEQLGIDTLFSISTTAREHMPSVASQIFVWPNFIDPATYRDYAAQKVIPVMLSGATAEQYPWRRRLFKLIAEHYPVLWSPHRGYLSRSSHRQVLHGVDYARTINASEFAAACGTVAREVVRKHFEIPACNTCLITERTLHVEEAGFEDMVNCVFADQHDVLDKMEFLFKNPQSLHAITTAGHQLVHSRHTSHNRDQILQWFRLWQQLGSTEIIVQDNPFAALRLSGEPYLSPAVPTVSLGIHLQSMVAGDSHLQAGALVEANQSYAQALSYMRRLPEARFKSAICKLHQGDALGANTAIFELIRYSLTDYGAVTPDPIEWAYYAVSQLCLGRLDDALASARSFPDLHCLELERVRNAIRRLSPSVARIPVNVRAGRESSSVHQPVCRTEEEWNQALNAMLFVCRQGDLAAMLRQTNTSVHSIPLQGRHHLQPANRVTEARSTARPGPALLLTGKLPAPIFRRLTSHRVKQKTSNVLSRLRLRLTRAMPFVPAFQRAGLPPLISAIRRAFQSEHICSCLILSDRHVEITAALRHTSPSRQPQVVLNASLQVEAPIFFAKPDTPQPDDLSSVSLPSANYGIDCSIADFLRQHAIESFDLVVVDQTRDHAALLKSAGLWNQLALATFVLFGDLRQEVQMSLYSRLSGRCPYVLLDAGEDEERYVILKTQVSPGPASTSIDEQPNSDWSGNAGPLSNLGLPPELAQTQYRSMSGFERKYDAV